MARHIQMADITLSYHWRTYSKQIFQNLNLSIERGQFVSIIGSNGSGKSSLIKLLLGLARPDSGQIILEGEPVRYGFPSGVREGRIAYFSQEIQELFFGETVGEELAYARGQDAGEPGIPGLDLTADRSIGTLSGGERQFLGLSEFMASTAPLLILDEPSSFLDLQHAHYLREFLLARHGRGSTILHVTQYPSEVNWGSHLIDLDDPQPAIVPV